MMGTKIAAFGAVAAMALAGCASASAQQDIASDSPTMAQANVVVDFSQSRGPLLRTERFNTWDNGDPEPDLREGDVAFLNEQGLQADIIRIGIGLNEEMCDLQAQSCDFSNVDWIFDVAGLTDSIVMHLTPDGLFEDNHEPADLLPLLTLAISELKSQVPNIDYIEAFNEPDWVDNVLQLRMGNEPHVTPQELYSWYVPFYQAVNTVNASLSPNDRIRVGGPTLMSFDHVGWIPGFLDGYAADPDPNKRLDFVSWHGYGYFDESTDYQTYVFFKEDPTMVAAQRARLDAMLEERGLSTYLPALVTETGIYPGPAYDDPNPSKNDWVRQGPGLASLHYWYAEQPDIYPFHWTIRHAGEGRKDQLVTLRGDGETSPTGTFTPYGNTLLMQSMLRDERVVAESDALVDGKGVYAIATRGNNGSAIMIWNYQGTDSRAFRVNVNLGGFPANAPGHMVSQREYRIDADTSNYWTDPQNANLQQVGQTSFTLGASHQLTIDLPANAMHLITLDIESGNSD